jgi:hypothetical protein
VTVLGRLAVVPVPDVGPPPEAYSMGGAVVAALVVTAVGVVLFVWAVLGARRHTSLSALWVSTLVPLVLMIGGAGVGYVLDSRARDAHVRDVMSYQRTVAEAQPAVREQLEDAYGVTIDRPEDLPVVPGELGMTEMVLPDGERTTCWVDSERVYTLRCGSERFSETVPLPLQDAAGG